MENSRNFYPKFFPLFWVVSGFTMPIAVVCGIFDIGFITWKLFLFYSIVLGFDIVGTYLIIKVPVTLTSEGFKCIDWMWTYKFVTWDNIRFVKPSRAFFGLPYLRIGLNDSKEVTWLPIFLNELPEFVNLVIKYTDENSLLSTALKNYQSTK